jgi:hypothetical protein
VELVTVLVTINRVGEQGTEYPIRPRRSRQQAARVLVDMNDGGQATPVSRSSTRGINISIFLTALLRRSIGATMWLWRPSATPPIPLPVTEGLNPARWDLAGFSISRSVKKSPAARCEHITPSVPPAWLQLTNLWRR